MCSFTKFIGFLFLTTIWIIPNCDLAVVKFTYIRCKSLDPNLVRIQRCYTRPISRNVTETSLLVSLARATSNITVRLSFMKKSTDYSLYFGERTYDACKFLANRKLYRIADYLFGIIEEYSNMNHSCPYQGDIIIDRFRIRNDKLTWVPMPEGEYAIYTFWKIDGKSSAEFNLFFISYHWHGIFS
ncbi:uncharacterized protein LOC101463203 [Ceratitis capitata]|uniref:uncharacterized protein LOC101463203 n=1 Tax=Ceratitis capitata TaxID=7213 RepID=UPI000618952B|nr:uncharacterized protein LOC101463203 [Ceratitis capitata]